MIVRRSLAVWILAVLCPSPGNAAFRESFEGPTPSWRLSDRDCEVQITRHLRSADQVHSGQVSELIQLVAGQGTFIHLSHPIPAARLIDELSIGMWVKSDRTGMQIIARVVFPRTNDPTRAGPLRTLLRGTSYQRVGAWERLEIADPRQMLAQQIPLLRSQYGSQVDMREAYLDLLVLNAYGGPGRADIWIDDLAIEGLVAIDRLGGDASTGDSTPTADSMAGRVANHSSLPLAADPAASGRSVPVVQTGLVGSVFTIDGRPALIRAVEHNGESFALLKKLGFNAIRLPAPPTHDQYSEARRAGIKLIAPPPAAPPPAAPPPAGPSPAGPSPAARVSSDGRAEWEVVLAWDLGDGLGESSLVPIGRLARKLHGVDSRARKPLLCSPDQSFESYSRVADAVVLRPPNPLQSISPTELQSWVLDRVGRMRLGTPVWVSIPTQVSPRVMQQIRSLSVDAVPNLSLEPEQIRMAAYQAIGAGARGLLFRSTTRLDQTDRQTLMRAKSLEWINTQMSLIEPWASTGTYSAEVDTADPGARVSMLTTDRSRLIIAFPGQATLRAEHQSPAESAFADRSADVHTGRRESLAFDLFGVPETDEVYRVEPGGLRRVVQRRGTGLHVVLDRVRKVNLVVLTQDRLVVNFLARQINSVRRQRDDAVAEIAAQMYSSVVDTHQRILKIQPAALEAADTLKRARDELQHFEQLVEGGGHERSFEFLRRGLSELAHVRQSDLSRSTAVFADATASPLCASFFALPYHYALASRLRGATWGPNVLPAGDFESVSHLQSSGWENLCSTRPGVVTAVELSLDQIHSGRRSLHLHSRPPGTDDDLRPPESSPVRVRTAAVPVEAGRIVHIHGWAYLPQSIEGPFGGLRITDSLGGPDLALRITESDHWREFSMFRAAPQTGQVSVDFGLYGWGDAWVDHVTINVLQSYGAR